MRRVTRSRILMLLSALILMVCVGCAGNGSNADTASVKVTPTPATPPGLLIFSSTGKRVYDKAGNGTQNYTTTLSDLNPQTGAILWKSPAYAGKPVQRAVVVGTRAVFAIGANLSDTFTGQPGTVSIYAADLANGAITSLGTVQQVYYSGLEYNLSMVRLGAATVVLRYAIYQSANNSSMALLAFTSTPDSPLWRANLPNMTFLQDIAVAGDTIEATAYDRAAKTHSIIAFNGTDGSILWQKSQPGVAYSGGHVFTDGLLIQMESAASNSASGWELAAYSLHDGTLAWKQATGSFATLYGAADGLVLYSRISQTSAQGGTLTAAHTSSGAQAWTALPGYASVDGDATHLCMTFSGQSTQVACLASADGSAAWSHTWPSTADHQASASEPVVYQGSVYVGVTVYDANRDPILPSTVYALSAAGGSTLWHQTITGMLRYPVETNRS